MIEIDIFPRVSVIPIMRVHFIFPFARSDWPMVEALKRKLPEATLECQGVSGFGSYHHRFQQIAKFPWLANFAYRSWMARIKKDPLPDFICVGSDIEVIGCTLARFISGKKIPIIWLGFIYTPRKSALLSRLRWLYFRFVLSLTDGVICYSKFEREFLTGLFELKKTVFASMKFGGNVNLPKNVQARNEDRQIHIVSAGRSGRDYELLCEAVRDFPVTVNIICDSVRATKDLELPTNVRILRDCHGSGYLEELAKSDMVLIPLKDDQLSSGQMVLLDAMALGKPAIITRTATSVEYAEHMKTCCFVEIGSVDDMRSAIDFFMRHPEVMESIAKNGQRHFAENHSLDSYVESLVAAIEVIAQNARTRSVA